MTPVRRCAALCTHVTYSNISRHWFAGGSLSLEDAIDWTTMVSEQEQRFAGIKALSGTRQRRLDRVVNTLPIANLDERIVARRVPYWRDIVEHASIDDPRWKPLDHSSRVAAVVAPVLQVGGWYDIFLPVQLDDYRMLIAAGKQPRLVIGPWTHIAPRGFAAQITESLRWLDRHVRGVGARDAVGEAMPVRLFVMGARHWRDFRVMAARGIRAAAMAPAWAWGTGPERTARE